MTNQQFEEPKDPPKGPRLLGKWDYIGCAIVAVLTGFGSLLISGSYPLGYAFGRFIAILVFWAVIKLLVLWVRGKFAR